MAQTLLVLSGRSKSSSHSSKREGIKDSLDFSSPQGIVWKFIPERGLLEATVKSVKHYLRRIVANARLTFEEFSTVLAQVEACLNSRPLVPLPCSDDGIEALTPGHFLIGRPLESLPDSSSDSSSLLHRWHLCQSLVQHFWKRNVR